uniref:BURP domain-containing protein n=1 Tax=Oryza punctata TaxID=4537 RepID=A0A0E0KZV1_ORYPU
MARLLAALLLVLVAAAGASHAASTAEMYWKIALPTSPMPGAIRDLINPVSSASLASKEDTVGSVFFLEKDLFPGSKMTLHFTSATAGAALLPRARAESIPFASSKLPEILTQLSIPAGSPTADAMQSTLAECEAARIAGEHKHYCATSLESMVEFVASSLGTRDVHALSTEVISRDEPTPRQAYRVEAVRPVPVSGGDIVACHGMAYAYAVFGLHGLKATAYTVAMAGADGSMVEALAACHADVDAAHGVPAETYKRLGVAPGSVPVCHFLPQDDMLWVRN